MGLTSWLKRQIEGNPEERAFKKKIREEAKEKERLAFEAEYRLRVLEQADQRGTERADKAVQGKSQGSGLLNTLGNIGEKMNRASEGLVKGIEINPDGATTDNPFNVDDPLRPTTFQNHKRKRRGKTLEVVDPFDTNDL